MLQPVQRRLRLLLLVRVAKRSNVGLGHRHAAGILGGHRQLAVIGGDGPDDNLPAFCSHVERLARFNLLHEVPFNGQGVGIIRLYDQRLGVGADDGAGDPIAILQSYLVGENRRRQNRDQQQS